MNRLGFLSFVLGATLISGCSSEKGPDLGKAQGGEPATVGTSGAADIARQDATDFIHHMAMVNMAEIELGKMAAERGTSAEVKKFGQMMVQDHTAAGDKLTSLATDLKIDSPGPLDDKHAELRDTLAKRRGADFDRDYASAMAEGHEDLIKQLEPRIDKQTLDQWKSERNGERTSAGTVAILPDRSDNPTTMRINQFAAGIYPTVHAHLEAAKALQRSVGKRHTTP
jgi:putative membrane protein